MKLRIEFQTLRTGSELAIMKGNNLKITREHEITQQLQDNARRSNVRLTDFTF